MIVMHGAIEKLRKAAAGQTEMLIPTEGTKKEAAAKKTAARPQRRSTWRPAVAEDFGRLGDGTELGVADDAPHPARVRPVQQVRFPYLNHGQAL